MVRRCVVPNCSSTDLTTLVHRFPRKNCTNWQTSLRLKSYTTKDLLEKYVVCAHHFRQSDYRHKESKHLNTTAIPTLDVIPDADKMPDVQTSSAKRSIVIHTTNVQLNGEPSKSTLGAGKTQMYSNCVTLSSSFPLQINNNSQELHESDNSFEADAHCEGDIFAEEIYMDEEMLIDQSNTSEDCAKELTKCDSVVEHLQNEVDDDAFTENASFIDDTELSSHGNTKVMLNDRLSDYVELLDTNEETDDECVQQCDQIEISNEIASAIEIYKSLSRTELIEHLVAATSRIKELETKLDNIQKAHLSIVQNLNNFNKVLIS